MANNSLYDGIIAPQGGLYAPGPQVMIPSSPAKQSAVVRALIASDPIGPGPGDGTGWPGFNATIDDAPNQYAVRSIDNVPSANGTMVAKDQTRLPGQVPAQFDPIEAYSGVPRGAPSQQAIETFAPRSAAFTDWPGWMAPSRSLVGAPQLAAVDPWANDRFGEPVAPQPGLATGTPGGVSPVAAALVAANERPITYSAPVAAGNFAQGSPNQAFEKQNGMGSVTNSMASSSRWNTGY